MGYEYVENLYKEKNIEGLKDELKIIDKIISNYKEELIELFNRGNNYGKKIDSIKKCLDSNLELENKIRYFISELYKEKDSKGIVNN